MIKLGTAGIFNLLNVADMPGRSEQKEREQKRAAVSCQKLDAFLLAPKRKREIQSGDTEEVPAASISVTQESYDGSTTLTVPEPATRNSEVALEQPRAEETRTVPDHYSSGYVEDVGSPI